MGGKYQKPFARNLGEVATAIGACYSGLRVLQECLDGASNVGPCSVGDIAGQVCDSGGAAGVATPPCTVGGLATNCSTGQRAGKL